MSTPQKRKGDKAERDLVAYLNANGFPQARRTKAGGEKDLGDLSGVVDRDGDLWCVQVADRKWRSHGELLAKAATVPDQAEELGAPFWCMVAKRPGCSDPGDWFVWLQAWQLAYLLRSAALTGDGAVDHACITVRTWVALTGLDTAEVAA